jgi:hypothetical protein
MNVWKRASRRALAGTVLLAVAACGGGGSSSVDAGSLPTPDYSAVQPAVGPAHEALDNTRAIGAVAMAGDPFRGAGLRDGVQVQLNEVLAGGALGPVAGNARTDPDGRFSIAMPSGSSTAQGRWLITATHGANTLRAYVHSGEMRVDVGSESLVRHVIASRGGLHVFADVDVPTLKSLAHSVSLYAEAVGADHTGFSIDAAVGSLMAALGRDRAMAYLLSTLARTGALPAGGAGDIGSFSAIAMDHMSQHEDRAGAPVFVRMNTYYFGPGMSEDGSWQFQTEHYRSTSDYTPIPGKGGIFRVGLNLMRTILPLDSPEQIALSNAVGEIAMRSFPLQGGRRQLTARRIERTGLNFTGGADDQPVAVSHIEHTHGVEEVSTRAGTLRAVRSVGEFELALPKAGGGVTRLTQRTTIWQAPGAGVLRSLDQVLIDGAPVPNTPDETLLFVSGRANGELWPNRVKFSRNQWGANEGLQCITPLPGTTRLVVVYPDSVDGRPQLQLSDQGQVGYYSDRHFSRVGACPMPVGRSNSFLVPEAFPERQAATQWPASLAEAQAASDVIHHLGGGNLQQLNRYELPPIADASRPSLYWPAVVRFVKEAPGDSGSFVVGMSQSDQLALPQRSTRAQLLGPGTASPLVDLGSVDVLLADWAGGRLFTRESAAPFTLRVTPFSASSVEFGSTRVVTAGFANRQPWFASGDLLYMSDGTSIKVSDAGAGPSLGFTQSECGFGFGELLCLDWRNDRLLRHDPLTAQTRSVVPLSSKLRRMFGDSYNEPDLTQQPRYLRGIFMYDATTFGVGEFDVSVGRWPN